MWRRSLALEMVKQGIRANAVCPGVIATPMVKGIVQKDPNFEDWYKSKQPIGRMGRPEEVAQAVVWLCSDAASFVTGTGLDVDGAWMA